MLDLCLETFLYLHNIKKATFGLGYKLTLTRNIDGAVLSKDNAINKAKIKIDSIEWFVPYYTHHQLSKKAY